MATGIETAGVVLALLPVLVHQIGSYVEGLQMLNRLKWGVYRSWMERNYTALENERAILLNTLLIAVDGITYYGFGDQTSDSPAEYWNSPEVRYQLRRKLGDTIYGQFTNTLEVLLGLLDTLTEKLGLSVDRTGRSVLKKIRHLSLHTVYDDLIKQIAYYSGHLRTFVAQCNQIREINARRTVFQETLRQHQIDRQLASSLHNAIINGNYWPCLCKPQHRLYFMFDFSNSPWTCDPSNPPDPKSPMMKLKMEVLILENPNRWHEVEAKPDNRRFPQELCRDSHTTSSQQGLSIDGNIPNISFPQGIASTEQGTVIGAQDLPAAVQITNMCVSLSAVGINESNEMLLGYVTDTMHRLNIYHLRSNAESVRNIHSKSLEELFATLSSSPSDTTVQETFTVQDRLKIAVDLACAVLQFHGSWLKREWRARDILVFKDPRVPKPEPVPKPVPVPYVEWDLNNEPSQVQAGTPFIHLGFVLVELSQCQTLEALKTGEDHDEVQVVANRNTALRLLPFVEATSGQSYRQATEQCLNWPNCTLDNDNISKAVRSIIAPLVGYWRMLKGTEHPH
ncbi:uncharacterized protein BO87DRAFT_405369 [Aspergillus neoniger CBS 115656]|uniref:DUF7580 domain-containing protein n=1 Tax=Aspergillus neoniger (strain CBS 115656) TaxID=1448310 RepID=A0A318YQD2_ASPNB|nr:hypothetical protein BO87DRAFT_405369 [Aspergillus neoniger CBS 115656]PYH36544.1 hypothetical protein BO87DRAFT_405369 [Aspergillus neoniger CBS 115656]